MRPRERQTFRQGRRAVGAEINDEGGQHLFQYYATIVLSLLRQPGKKYRRDEVEQSPGNNHFLSFLLTRCNFNTLFSLDLVNLDHMGSR